MDTTTVDTTRAQMFQPRMASQVGSSTQTPGWDLATERRIDDGRSLASAMGWFSLGLGIVEVVAAKQLARYLGMKEKTELVRLYGLREIASGVGIFSSRTPTGWMWSRVGGDLLDLATLASALTPENRHRKRVMGAILAVTGALVVDAISVQQLHQSEQQPIRH